MTFGLSAIDLGESPLTKTVLETVCTTEMLTLPYVTGFWKTLRMGFFVKIEFDVSLINSTLELTHLQV